MSYNDLLCVFHSECLQGWREIIRFIPPLVITEAEMATAIEMLKRGFETAVKTFPSKPVKAQH